MMLQRAAPSSFASLSQLVKAGFLHASVYSCNKFVEVYGKSGLLDEARRLFDEMPERNVFTWNAMIHGYVRNKDLASARSLFDSAPVKDSVTYNTMIVGYAGDELCEGEAIELFDEMRRNIGRADGFTFTTMLNVAAKLFWLDYGRQIHACMVKTGSGSDGFGATSLIDMYSKCGCFSDAVGIFDGFEQTGNLDHVSKNAMVAACCREGKMEMAFDLFWRPPAANDIVSWNTLISGCAQNGLARDALTLFIKMTIDGVGCNEHTVVGVLIACSNLKSLRHGKQVHAWVLKNDFGYNPFIGSCIVEFYCKCSELKYAYAIHSLSCNDNVFSATSLIVGYSQKGKMEEARRLFDLVHVKNPVVWTAIFCGYIKSHLYDEVFNLLRESAREDAIVFDALLLVNVLSACALQTNMDYGKQIHCYITRMEINVEEKLGTALVDMYAKCGNIRYAENIFLQVANKDHVLYNAMIAGSAHNGQEEEAIQLFEEMVERGLRPDAVTFIALLAACRHAGFVERGDKYFNSMITKYEIVPEIDHYSSMIDLLGRANQLDRVVSLIKSIPFEPDAIIWGTFMNACRMNGNTELAKVTEEKVLRMEAENGARYVQLANTFAAKGEWTEVERIRKKMRGGEVKKLAGCSWVQVANKMNAFISGDRFHFEAEAIYNMISTVYAEMMDNDICL